MNVDNPVSLIEILLLVVAGIVIWIMILYIFIWIPGALISKKIHQSRIKKDAHKIPFYEPPKDITPADMVFLQGHEHIEQSETAQLATIIFLQLKGKLLDYKDKTLNEYEKSIINGIFNPDNKEDPNNKYLSNNIAIPLGFTTSESYQIKEKFYKSNYLLNIKNQKITSLIRAKYFFPIIVFFTSAIYAIYGFLNTTDHILERLETLFGLMFVAIFLSMLVGLIINSIHNTINNFRIRNKLKNDFKNEYTKIQGYDEFLKIVEKDNIQYELKDKNNKITNEHLPYAVALKIVKIRDLDNILERINKSEYNKLIQKKHPTNNMNKAQTGLLRKNIFEKK